jgi:hypothetical protein
MATKPEIDAVILDYAKTTPMFVSPATKNDNIVPIPAQMGDAQFGQFINTLVAKLNGAGVVTQVVAGDMRSASIWDDVSLSLFNRQ